MSRYECDCGQIYSYADGPIFCGERNHGNPRPDSVAAATRAALEQAAKVAATRGAFYERKIRDEYMQGYMDACSEIEDLIRALLEPSDER